MPIELGITPERLAQIQKNNIRTWNKRTNSFQRKDIPVKEAPMTRETEISSSGSSMVPEFDLMTQYYKKLKSAGKWNTINKLIQADKDFETRRTTESKRWSSARQKALIKTVGEDSGIE